MNRLLAFMLLFTPCYALQMPSVGYGTNAKVWHLNESAGSVVKDTLSSTPGTATGTAWVTGKFGAGISMLPRTTSTESNVNFPNVNGALTLDRTKNWSMGFWLWVDSNTFGTNAQGGWLFEYGGLNDGQCNVHAIFLTNTVVFTYCAYGYESCSGNSVSFIRNAGWYHIVITGNGDSRGRVYINGVYKGYANGGATTCSPNASAQGFVLNDCHSWGGANGSGGIWDDVFFIKDYDLSAAEIKRIYQDGLSRHVTGD